MSDIQKQAASEPRYAADASEDARKKLPWYSPNIDKYLTPEARKVLSEYCNVPESEHSKHLHEIRDQAWAIRSYPCTGLGIILVDWVTRTPAYEEIVTRMKAGALFLDIGCFVGADMRALARAGAPTSNIYGIDIVSHWEVGFNLFRDRGRFDAHFIEADMLSDNSELKSLFGRADIVSISAVLHQWDWDTQVRAIKRVVEFSKLDSIVIGYQVGSAKGKSAPVRVGVITFQHDAETFKQLWEQVGKETGTEWDARVELKTDEEMGWDKNDCKWMPPDHMVVCFLVRRVK